MDSAKKLEFVHKMTKMGLQHFDAGGPVLSGPTTSGVSQNATNPNTGIAGTVGGALGLNNNFQAGAASVQAGTNAGQLNSAYQGAQQGLGYQSNLASTLAPQASSAVANQNQLAAQLQAQANGQGPNVAQNQLNQATGQNVASQAALMAGQRGASSNVGLMARQAAQNGAATQQAAAGQAATLGAQQQIAAQQNEASLAANQISQAGQAGTNLSSAQQGEQGILQNANTSYNNANVGMQSNINNVNAQTSAANQNMSGNIFGAVTSGGGALSSLGLAKGGVVKKMADGGSVSSDDDSDLGNFQPANSQASSGPSLPSTATDPVPTSNPLAPSSSKSSGGGGGIASLAALLAKGGKVQHGYMNRFASGGDVIVGNPLIGGGGGSSQSAPASFVGQYLNNTQASSGPNIGATSSDPAFVNAGWGKQNAKPQQKTQPTQTVAGGAMDNNTQDPNQFNDVTADPTTMMAASGGAVKKQLAAKGGNVKADNKNEKAVKNQDSYSNDKIPALLSEGEVVLDKNTMNDPGPMGQMARALAAHIAKRNKQK